MLDTSRAIWYRKKSCQSCYATIGYAFKTYNSQDELERFLENIADELELFKDRYQGFTLVDLTIKY